jgi:hypothetical protein
MGGNKMANFSVGAAAGAGFQIIGKKPRSVFAWGLFYVLIGVLPALALVGSAAPDFMAFVNYTRTHAGAPPPPEMVANMQSQMLFAHPIIRLLSAVVKTVACAAVFRAVLEPKNSAFAYLRFGMQEVWIFLVTLVEMILIGIGMVAAIIVSALIVGGLAIGVSHPAGVIAGVCLGLAILVGLCWVALRLSMATPMSFDERQFRLFESWKLTRGHAWSLLLLVLLLIVIAIGFDIVLWAVLGAAAMLSGVHHLFTHETFQNFITQPPQKMLVSVAPYAVVFGLILAFLIGAAQAIFLAPWAAAYQMLKGEPTPD